MAVTARKRGRERDMSWKLRASTVSTVLKKARFCSFVGAKRDGGRGGKKEDEQQVYGGGGGREAYMSMPLLAHTK